MKQYCLKLDDWLAESLEKFLAKANEDRYSWNRIARNRVINEAIKFYLDSKKKK